MDGSDGVDGEVGIHENYSNPTHPPHHHEINKADTNVVDKQTARSSTRGAVAKPAARTTQTVSTRRMAAPPAARGSVVKPTVDTKSTVQTPSVASPPPAASTSRSITIGLLNMGGGTNPLEFLSASITEFDDVLGEFMTSERGLTDLCDKLDKLTCMQERAKVDSYITAMKRLIDSANGDNGDGGDLTKLKASILKQVNRIDGVRESDAVKMINGNPKDKRHKKNEKNVIPASILAVLAIADDRGDMDAENHITACGTRYNPFNRAKNLCPEEGSDGSDDGIYAFVKAVRLIERTHANKPMDAFNAMVCTAALRWEKMVVAWDKYLLANPKDDDDYKGNPVGVLFYDVYCAYFMCFLLKKDMRLAIDEHFHSYLANDEPTPALASFVDTCDVFAIVENKETPRQHLQIMELMSNRKATPTPIVRENRNPDNHTAFVLGEELWKVSPKSDEFRKHMLTSLAKDAQFLLPFDVAVALSKANPAIDEPGEYMNVSAVTLEDVSTVRKDHGLKDDKQYKKVIKGIQGFKKKADFVAVTCHSGGTDTTLNIALIHGKDYKEVAPGLETASLINTLMGGDGADVVVGDFNVTFKKNPLFFRSLRALLEKMKTDTDYASETMGANLAAACTFLEGHGFLADDPLPHVKFLPDICVVPMDTITTKKTRGFISVQPGKIHDPVSEMKDFVFYKRSKVVLEENAVFPSADRIKNGALNTGEWPMDHAGIRARFAVRPSV